MRLKLLTVLLLIHISIATTTAQTTKQDAIQQFLNTPGLQQASIGFVVKDFSGKTIASYNQNKSYTPASILKVITTATAIETLGADYRYKTTLAKDETNPNRLFIHGYGDPTLGTEHLDNIQYEFASIWANEIEKAYGGKKDIDILVIDNYFGYRGISRKWIHEDIGNYYGAAAYGISVFDNTYRLSFNTKNTTIAPKILGTDPQMDDIKFTNTLSLNTTNKDNGYILGAPFSNERTIIGNIPAGREKFTIKGDIPNPGLVLGQTIGKYIENKGMRTNSIGTSYETYHNEMYSPNRTLYKENIFYTHFSPTLTDIVRDVNVRSNNHYAEHLIRTIGRTRNSDIYSLALDEGINEVQSFWASKGLQTKELFMYDGCGLAPTNAVSADFMSNVLIYMQSKSRHAVSFLASFAKAGQEGTVRSLLKGTRLEGKVYVKSGSIADVQCFAGYYIDGNKKYAFTIIVNKYSAPRSQVVRAIEKLLLGTL